MIVHFVCAGNSFRSRLAEAYMKSLRLSKVKVISSGTRIHDDQSDFISPHAQVVINNEHLNNFVSLGKVQINQDRIDSSDIVICVNRSVYQDCLELGLSLPKRTYIWNIEDIYDFDQEQKAQMAAGITPPAVQRIYKKIQAHVDELAYFLTRSHPMEAIDVLDIDGRLTGRTADIETIHQKGWWASGIHVGLYTKTGDILLERRSKTIIYNPGLWDVTMGGVMSAGEIPEQAAARELKEELGIVLPPNHLQKVFVQKYSHYLPHYGYHIRSFVHAFIAQIPESVHIHMQDSEVSGYKFLPIDEVYKLNEHIIRSDVHLMPEKAFFDNVLDAIRLQLKQS